MERSFHETLSALRRGRHLSQRRVARELGISQALLSHYENGAREPGLAFVCRACDYYGVTADYLLCRTEEAVTVDRARARDFLRRMEALLSQAEESLEQTGGERE